MLRTFACELRTGDTILSRQTFGLESVSNFAPHEITLDRDYEVLRTPVAVDSNIMHVVVRPRRQKSGVLTLSMTRGRLVRTA